MSFEVDLALDALGISDGKQRDIVQAAIPVAAKLFDHANDNQALLATMWADIQLLIPAAKIVLDALAARQRSVP